jgi:poly-gamma-glutamate synthesis protein (capsule biosynthesis protein)
MKVALTGDVMLGRLVNDHVMQHAELPPAHAWGNVLPLLQAADVRLINLECVISTRGQPWHPATKAFHFRAAPRAIDVLTAAGITGVTLANNHTLDYGWEALEECLALLDQAGIAHAGAGKDLDEALAPASLDTSWGRIALIAVTDNEPAWEATPDHPGINFVAYDAQGLVEPYRSRMTDALTAARRQADLVIVSAHVGRNWGPPTSAMRALAHELIDLGADIYWGHSNHTPLGMEVYQHAPIIYAAGDFIDDYAVDPRERNDLSFLFVLEVTQHQVERVRLHPVAIDRFQVRHATPTEAAWLMQRMQARSAALGSRVILHADWCELVLR